MRIVVGRARQRRGKKRPTPRGRRVQKGNSVNVVETELTQPEGLLIAPEDATGVGVLVLSGSSGRIEAERARLLAGVGATALSIRWFGGPGQQADTYEVPLEIFFGALDRLASSCDRLVVVGSSFGAEAALLTGVHDHRVDAVVAIAPTPVVWAGVAPEVAGEGVRQTSHWTLGGAALPFVPFVESWEPDSDPPAFRGLYAQSLKSHPEWVAAAEIPVERIRGDVVVIGGEDDRVWPGADFARMVSARRANHGLSTTLVTHPSAGHRVLFPGESPVTGGAWRKPGGRCGPRHARVAPYRQGAAPERLRTAAAGRVDATALVLFGYLFRMGCRGDRSSVVAGSRDGFYWQHSSRSHASLGVDRF